MSERSENIKPARFGKIELRPRYCECDPMGVVHHASYVPWLEMGRTELLRDSGLTYAQLEAKGVLLVVVKLELNYRKSARYDDVLEIVKVADAQSPGQRLSEPVSILAATSTLACVDRTGRPGPLPDWLVLPAS
jgi:acyl-CoA thioester hydrolase